MNELRRTARDRSRLSRAVLRLGIQLSHPKARLNVWGGDVLISRIADSTNRERIGVL